MNFMIKIRVILFFSVFVLLCSCGQSGHEGNNDSGKDSLKTANADSVFNIAVLPTLDCLPFYIACENKLFADKGVDVRLTVYKSQMDCDTAIISGYAQAAISDIVRAEHMKMNGCDVDYWSIGGSVWSLVVNKNLSIDKLNKLNEKMLSMARYSATHYLADTISKIARLDDMQLFQIQINDIGIRYRMLMNNQMDALLLPEPYATSARMKGHAVLFDSKKIDMPMGALIVCAANDKLRNKQIADILEVYNAVCKSIDENGIKSYNGIISKYCGVEELADSIPADIKYGQAVKPQVKDVERIVSWLNKQ